LKTNLSSSIRKLISDSAEVVAAEMENNIANQQLIRGKQMYAQGVIPLTELEKRTDTAQQDHGCIDRKTAKNFSIQSRT